MIQKLLNSGTEARFGGDPKQHHHAWCIHCGRVDGVSDPPEDFVKGKVHGLAGYDIVGFRLDFVGVCPDFQDERGADGGGASAAERE